ncbi:nucleotidyltransferase family protein [Nostoc mirabile]|uniref:nucleotidyltransferase family protein n=1 Tax=Nostoc mirabile TaxID=2907820 RepID=UPI001E55AF7D|nr:nucleotidyltransferase family protein [Nostoc mirabile]
MGTPKQLLPIQGRSLLRHLAAISIASLCNPVIVVLGASVHQTRPEIEDLPLQVVENQHWQSGMGTSISAGLAALLEQKPALNAVLILVCDQPFVSTALINQLVVAYQSTDYQIVATTYLETVGVPALFSDRYFSELLSLNSDTGARQIIQQHLNETYTLAFPKGAIDLDTPDQYQAFLDNEAVGE